jgi:hypothetical protein
MRSRVVLPLADAEVKVSAATSASDLIASPAAGASISGRADLMALPSGIASARFGLPCPVHSKMVFTRDRVVLSFDSSLHSVQPCELL